MTAPKDIATSENSNAVSVASTRLLGGFHGHERTTAQTHDWITPRYILDALGPFDLDPCMSLHQPWETATNGFTVLDDGLSREWTGHVWLNPPYGSQIAEWMERMARHGDGIALVFARSDTKWFQSVSKAAAVMLFLAGRVRFHDTRGGKFQRTGGGSCATSPSVLIGYGDRAKETLLKCPLEGVKLCPPNASGDARRDGGPHL